MNRLRSPRLLVVALHFDDGSIVTAPLQRGAQYDLKLTAQYRRDDKLPPFAKYTATGVLAVALSVKGKTRKLTREQA